MSIFEMRTYSLKPNMTQAYLRFYHDHGSAIHVRHLGPSVGWWQSEVGALNQVIMLWRYEDFADREQRRMALAADPEWQAFIPQTAAYIERMENRILRPTFFSPMQ